MTTIKYTGIADERHLSAADLEKLGVDKAHQKDLVFLRGVALEVDEKVADALLGESGIALIGRKQFAKGEDAPANQLELPLNDGAGLETPAKVKR